MNQILWDGPWDMEVEDLKDLRFRTVGLSATLFSEMGAAVKILPGGEIIPAMIALLIAGWSYASYSYSIGERSLQSPFGPIIWPRKW